MFADPAYCRIQAEKHRRAAARITLPAVKAALERSAARWDMMAVHGEEFRQREQVDQAARAERQRSRSARAQHA
jgi:hypothetical protein